MSEFTKTLLFNPKWFLFRLGLAAFVCGIILGSSLTESECDRQTNAASTVETKIFSSEAHEVFCETANNREHYDKHLSSKN
ncbi:MAG TPA: hypothetical protein VEX64_02500 [Pyrinomonadaceae bacterium]|nr:hypothetical protein [Pyrinomonadaceae bacterium]